MAGSRCQDVERDDRNLERGGVRSILEMRRVPASMSTIQRWAARRLGRADGRVTVASLAALPREEGLRYDDVGSPLGGRLSDHLEHLDDRETARLTQKADAFLGESDPDKEPASASARGGAADHEHELASPERRS